MCEVAVLSGPVLCVACALDRGPVRSCPIKQADRQSLRFHSSSPIALGFIYPINSRLT